MNIHPKSATRGLRSTVLLLTIASLALAAPALGKGPDTVTLDAASPLLEVRIMVKAGSADDPAGLEGLAHLVADALIEGGFGEAEDPITKEELARMTRAWGQGARPDAFVEKEVTTFRLTVPADVLDEYCERVLSPIFGSPLFLEEEVSRLKNEALTRLTGAMRYEEIELLGLEAMDNYIYDGTSYGHMVTGSVQGVKSIDAAAVRAFYAKHYRPDNIILGVSTAKSDLVGRIEAALADAGKASGDKASLKTPRRAAAAAVEGRELTVIGMPDAGATGIHLAYPLPINRSHPDFWPLYVANVYFGTHRDGHGALYGQIRQTRGYNYGDYSYVEHFAMRPRFLFPPFNTPRVQQYFSIWIRPVAHEYAHHLLKAAVWELETLVRRGISEEAVEKSKNKAKVLYLNLGETSARLLEAKMDDAYYGMSPGYLDGYLERIESVTAEQVNAAVQKYLQADDLKMLLVTGADQAEELAADIRADRNSQGKSLGDYQITSREEEGTVIYEVPESKLDMLQRDAAWSHHWLDLDPARIRTVPVEAIFETGAFVSEIVEEDSAR